MAGNIQNTAKKCATMRLFFALWPTTKLRDAIHAEAVACGQAYGGRVMRKETLHMTLLFLGDVPQTQVVKLVGQVSAMQKPAFAFQLTQRRCWRHNRIAYLGVDLQIDPLERLVLQLVNAAENAGVECDKRGFTPHVTLLRKMEHPCESKPVALPIWNVTDFTLVESVLDEGGAYYRNVHAWKCS